MPRGVVLPETMPLMNVKWQSSDDCTKLLALPSPAILWQNAKTRLNRHRIVDGFYRQRIQNVNHINISSLLSFELVQGPLQRICNTARSGSFFWVERIALKHSLSNRTHFLVGGLQNRRGDCRKYALRDLFVHFRLRWLATCF
jgi:hypothetical protein